ncbi:MAG TPA: PD-(D/E)XK nuclease family protein [Gemmatimonadota bacterium]|jgi:hypothetical protein
MLTVVPSRRAGARIADTRAVPAGGALSSRAAWTDDAVTLSDLVDRALATDPAPRRRLGRVASALLAADILRELETEALRLFGPGVEGPGASRAIAAAIAEVRSAGLFAVDLVPAARGSRRIAALAAVVDAWERRLRSAGLVDAAGAVARATELVRAGSWPAADIDALEVHGIYDVTAVQGELLLALARRANRVRVHVPFEPHDPSATAYAYPYVQLWESLTDPGLDVELDFFQPQEEAGPVVEFRSATDPVQEARRAADDARAWIDAGVAAEEIAIVVPGSAHRVAALDRELSRRGVEHHARRGAPLAETPGIAAALAPFSLIEEGLPRDRLEAWIASPLTAGLEPELLLPVVSSGPAAGATREEWNRTLSAARGEAAARLVAALATIVELGRGESAPEEFWRRYGDVLARVGLLDGLAARDSAGLALWEGALLELRGAHETLGTWSGPPRGWRAHRRSILDALGDARAPLGRPGRGVAILTARDARDLAFRRQIMVGLVQGALTRPAPAAAVLGDPERRALNRSLDRRAFRTAAEDTHEGDLLVIERIRSTAERIVLSWPVEDENATPLLPGLEVERERERRGTEAPGFPSPTGIPAWREGRAPGAVSALQSLERDRTLFFARDPATRRAAAGRWDGAFDSALAEALAAEAAGGALSTWSASALESWSQCAHQFFQRHLLRLRPPDERPLEAEPTTVGDLAHLALKRLFEAGGRPWDLERIREAVDLAGTEVRDDRKGPPAVWALTRRRTAATIHRYLQAVAGEEAASGRQPVAFEASFGRDGSRIPAVAVPTRFGPIELRGTIDRLDRHPASGDLHVVDYKYSPKRRDHLEAVDPERCGVERFQLHAYFLGALAWAESEALPRPSTVTGAIHCVKAPAIAGPLVMPDADDVRAGIARAVEAAAGGVFDPTPRDARGCRWCDFRRGCRIATVPGVATDVAEEDE